MRTNVYETVSYVCERARDYIRANKDKAKGVGGGEDRRLID